MYIYIYSPRPFLPFLFQVRVTPDTWDESYSVLVAVTGGRVTVSRTVRFRLYYYDIPLHELTSPLSLKLS